MKASKEVKPKLLRTHTYIKVGIHKKILQHVRGKKR